MSYKNTMKLFVSNFALAWKQLVYLFCCAVLFALCTYTLVTPIIDVLRAAGLGTQIRDFFSTIYSSPKSVSFQLSNVIELVFASIIGNMSKIYLNLIAAILLCIILPYILIQMSIFNMSSILHQKLTMNMEVNYIRNGISKLGESFRFALTNLLLSLPVIAITILLFYAYISFSTTILKSLIGLVVLSTFLIIIESIKIAFTTYYTGLVVADKQSPLKAFTKSIPVVLKNFWKLLGQSIVILLTVILINGVISIFTFFAGILFTIPATMMLICIFKIITYLNLSENRYYLSDSVIYNPLKYNVKKDDYVATFVSPEETKEITTTKMKNKYSKKALNAKPKKEKSAKKTKSTKNKNLKENKKTKKLKVKG